MKPSKETLALVNTFKNPILDLLTDIKDEVKFYFDDGIVNYVESIRGKFIKTKTFLFRLETINFYDVYHPISLSKNSHSQIIIDEISDLFTQTNFISIIGNAGCGKSMVLKDIFLKTITQTTKIPVVLELRNLNDYGGSLFDYIDDLLRNKNLTPNKKILDRILKNGEFIFLFDGYDEIYSNVKNKITAELIDFIDTYNHNYFVITSRPGANIESLPRFDSYVVNKLSPEQIKAFIIQQLKVCEDLELADKILKTIEIPENKDYRTYLSSPLLLSMFIMTFNSYPEIPKSKNKFYWNVFDTLCTKHDAFTKFGGYQHERRSGLQNEDFENILMWFSYTSIFKGKYAFDEQYFSELLKKILTKLELSCNLAFLKEDLTTGISIIIQDGLEYKFPHKSLQEYFAATLIKDQKEKIKIDIYSKKMDQISQYSFGGGENFWSLCSELDPYFFKKHFLLRHLDNLVDNPEMSEPHKGYKSLIQGGNHTFNLVKDDKGRDSTSLITSYSISSEIIKYFKVDGLVHEPFKYLRKEMCPDNIHNVIHFLLWSEMKDLDNFKKAFEPKSITRKKTYYFKDANQSFQNKIVRTIKDYDEYFRFKEIIEELILIRENLIQEISRDDQNNLDLLSL